MVNKTTGLIITIASAALFGCPGLFLIGFAIIALLPGGTEQLSTGGYQVSIVALVIGVILLIVPFAVGFFTLRTNPENPANDQNVPPIS